MPFATITRVREVSSEDSVHLAENLIKSQPGKKWKTKRAGEKSAYVILEMSDCHQITGIDIGNEHSAFVEVLVGKSSCAPEDFTEILITCSFMTPTESKSSNNINRVKCFNQEALVPFAAKKKWSLVKILCTQPFNKHVAYGLSFIKVHINDSEKNVMTSQKTLVPEKFINKTQFIGKLKLREDSPDSESENSSSLFRRWKKSKDCDVEQTAAASIRLASKCSQTLLSPQSNGLKKSQHLNSETKDVNILDRNRDKLLFGDENDDSNNVKLERLLAQIEADKERRRIERENEMSTNKHKSLEVKRMSENLKCVNEKEAEPSCSKNVQNSNCQKKRQSSPLGNPRKKIKSIKKYRPFNQLLKGVVLVISGIQNPDRGDLRNKAIALGAKYKADWDNTCTHLISAFKNTPKYHQVKGKGKIVTRNWIEKCYVLKKYLPWRRYALDSVELSKPESDEEILDESQKVQTDDISNNTAFMSSRDELENKNYTLALYDIDDKTTNLGSINNQSSESDTDDELNGISQGNKLVETSKSKTVDIYEMSTDEEDYTKEKQVQYK
ncbi:DNA repair protein XRCC1 isoform 1-T1 [Cochliomyia hominivorax]